MVMRARRSQPTPPPARAVASFAAAHLPDRTARAVYVVAASGRRHWWTATDVARAAHVDAHRADLVLRRLSAAGVLEREAADRPARYRWRPEMDYLVNGGQQPVEGELDPVCGMPVPPDSPHVLAGPDGAVWRFCALPCLLRPRRRLRRTEQGTRERPSC